VGASYASSRNCRQPRRADAEGAEWEQDLDDGDESDLEKCDGGIEQQFAAGIPRCRHSNAMLSFLHNLTSDDVKEEAR
jgi:hypothetical protein